VLEVRSKQKKGQAEKKKKKDKLMIYKMLYLHQSLLLVTSS